MKLAGLILVLLFSLGSFAETEQSVEPVESFEELKAHDFSNHKFCMIWSRSVLKGDSFILYCSGKKIAGYDVTLHGKHITQVGELLLEKGLYPPGNINSGDDDNDRRLIFIRK